MFRSDRPLSESIWDRAVSYLSSENPQQVYFDELTHYHQSGIPILTDVISEYYLDDEIHHVFVRGLTRERSKTHKSDNERIPGDDMISLHQDIRVFLASIKTGIFDSAVVQQDDGYRGLREKIGLLEFALAYQADWLPETREIMKRIKTRGEIPMNHDRESVSRSFDHDAQI